MGSKSKNNFEYQSPTEARVVDTRLWLATICKLLDEQDEVSLTVTGNSMSPFLADKRDRVILTKHFSKIRRGMIMLYRRSNGQYVLHRVVKCKKDKVCFCGDNQTVVEADLPTDCVIAKVVKVWRNGKLVQENNLSWKFYAHIWLALRPIRRVMFRANSLIKRTFAK
jgi:hypothetical protein